MCVCLLLLRGMVLVLSGVVLVLVLVDVLLLVRLPHRRCDKSHCEGEAENANVAHTPRWRSLNFNSQRDQLTLHHQRQQQQQQQQRKRNSIHFAFRISHSAYSKSCSMVAHCKIICISCALLRLLPHLICTACRQCQRLCLFLYPPLLPSYSMVAVFHSVLLLLSLSFSVCLVCSAVQQLSRNLCFFGLRC